MRPYPDGAKKNYRAPMTHQTDHHLPDEPKFSAFIDKTAAYFFVGGRNDCDYQLKR